MWLSTDNTQNKAKPPKGVTKNGDVRTLILSVSTLKLLTIARHQRHMRLTQTLHPYKHTVAHHSRKHITKVTDTSTSSTPFLKFKGSILLYKILLTHEII